VDVICIVGPTAVGKTKMSVELAKRLNGEIISGDSMQIYRGMDIGTAKATTEERQGIPHYLIDEKNPEEGYSVAEFQRTVRVKIEEIKTRGKLPILVGGTGLYIKSVLFDYEFSKEVPTEKKVNTDYQHLTNDQVYELLKEIDEKAALEIHPNNRKRVIRALEIFKETGVKKSETIEKQEHQLIYEACLIGLTDERNVLYERINHRVDKMFDEGLVEEVKRLFDLGIPKESQAIRAIGYKECYDYFEGLIDLETCKELIKRNSRRYAKRQYTWFRNQMDVNWFEVNINQFEKTILEVENFIKKMI